MEQLIFVTKVSHPSDSASLTTIEFKHLSDFEGWKKEKKTQYLSETQLPHWANKKPRRSAFLWSQTALYCISYARICRFGSVVNIICQSRQLWRRRRGKKRKERVIRCPGEEKVEARNREKGCCHGFKLNGFRYVGSHFKRGSSLSENDSPSLRNWNLTRGFVPLIQYLFQIRGECHGTEPLPRILTQIVRERFSRGKNIPENASFPYFSQNRETRTGTDVPNMQKSTRSQEFQGPR